MRSGIFFPKFYRITALSMNFFNNLFQGGKNIMKGGEHLIRSITPEDKKQRDEIKKLEQEIKNIQLMESKSKKDVLFLTKKKQYF